MRSRDKRTLFCTWRAVTASALKATLIEVSFVQGICQTRGIRSKNRKEAFMKVSKLVTAPTTIVLALAAAFFAGEHYLRAQGLLIPPPGAPAPTMKTLDQIEPRTALPGGTAAINITAPGSYYLAGNLAVTSGDGIVISASNVTLDLNGFTVSSTASPASGNGVTLGNNLLGIHIRNGHLQGTTTYNGTDFTGGGFSNGVKVDGLARGCRVSALSVTGVAGNGILDSNFRLAVDGCEVLIAGSVGIQCGVASQCQVEDFGTIGIYARTASDCVAAGKAGGQGIFAKTGMNCYVDNTGAGKGIQCECALNCSGTSNTGVGIDVDVAQNCIGSGSGGGIKARAAANCFGASANSAGISATTVTGCYGNSVNNRGINTDIATASVGYCISSASFGMVASQMANTCFGSSNSGTGLSAVMASFCRGASGAGLPVSATYKYDMP